MARDSDGNGRWTCEQMIAALVRTKGMVYLAAQELGCSHTTVYNYLKRHPSVKLAKEAAEGELGDTAELKLYDAILNDEHWAISFYLATKGKDRGYTKRTEQELSGPGGGPIETRKQVVDLSDLNDDELNDLSRLLARIENGNE